MDQVINVLIVDDHTLMRQGLRRILEAEGMRVVGEARDGSRAVALATELDPTVILMDIQMPVMDGIEATREIKKIKKDATIVMLTMHEEEQFLFEAVKAGAIGYLLKSRAPQELIQVIKAAAEGLSLLQPSMASKLLNEFVRIADRSEKTAPYERLTARESEVLNFIARGATDGEIAEQLSVDDQAVKDHLSDIFTKLQINDRADAAVIVVQDGPDEN